MKGEKCSGGKHDKIRLILQKKKEEEDVTDIYYWNTLLFYLFIYLFFIFLFIWLYARHILHASTRHKTTSLADEGNSAYCQSSGAHNIKHTQTYRN